MPKTCRVLITGTPSVGKTTVAREVSRITGYDYVDVAKIIIENQLYEGEDKERGSIIVDIPKARDFFSSFLLNIEKAVLDTHIVDIFPKRLVGKIIVLRAHPLLILRRGFMRGWSLKKCIENAQAELLGVCLFDAIRLHGEKKVWQVDCTCRSINDVVLDVVKIIEGKERGRRDIDWLSILEERGELDLLLKLEKASYLFEDLFKLLGNCR